MVAVVWPAAKPVPTMVMAVPPASGPELGITLAIVGGTTATASLLEPLRAK